jgi:hypothetical protein
MPVTAPQMMRTVVWPIGFFNNIDSLEHGWIKRALTGI